MERFQVPGPAQGRKDTLLSAILRSLHRVRGSGRRGSDAYRCEGKALPLRLLLSGNAVRILLRIAASLVWVSWSQGVKGQPRMLGPAVCSTGTTGEGRPLQARGENPIQSVKSEQLAK